METLALLLVQSPAHYCVILIIYSTAFEWQLIPMGEKNVITRALYRGCMLPTQESRPYYPPSQNVPNEHLEIWQQYHLVCSFRPHPKIYGCRRPALQVEY